MKTRRWIAACVLAGFLPLSTGCFGGFQLTRKVYRFNQQVSPDKWIREIVFLVLVIVPIYGIATFVDAIAFNLIEFWTGRNPALAENGDTQTIRTAQGTATLTRLSADALDVQLRATDGSESRFVMAREGETFAARAPDGGLLARVTEVDGRPALVGGAR
jgi:hypothetical protein